MNQVDRIYLDMLEHILSKGTLKDNRTGTPALSVFGYEYRVKVSEQAFPIVCVKKTQFRSMLAELLWFISGENHIRNLKKHSKIWDAWADERGDLDTAYGRYWRYYPMNPMGFGVEVEVEPDSPYVRQYEVHDRGGRFLCAYPALDQLGLLVHLLKTQPDSRRMLMTAWYAPNAHASKLPPCHHTITLNVTEGNLNLHLTQRSCDLGLGASFNISSYSLLLLMLAKEADLEPGELWHTITDLHLYVNHAEALQKLLGADHPHYPLPSVELNPSVPVTELSLNNLDEFKLVGYESGPFIQLPVAV